MTKHGRSGTRLYNIWKGMRSRCNNVNSKDYPMYGGRGIRVCPEWDWFPNFEDWAMANGYDDTLSIERLDVSRDYCPENCTWIPMNRQSRNRSNVIHITYKGVTHSLAEWSEIIGIPRKVVYMRYFRGMSVEKVLSPNHLPRHRISFTLYIATQIGQTMEADLWQTRLLSMT